MNECNAKIKKYSISRVDNMMKISLIIDNGTTLEFGGRMHIANLGRFVFELLRITEKSYLHDIVEAPIRVRYLGKDVYAVGHYLFDMWFNPEETFNA